MRQNTIVLFNVVSWSFVHGHVPYTCTFLQLLLFQYPKGTKQYGVADTMLNTKSHRLLDHINVRYDKGGGRTCERESILIFLLVNIFFDKRVNFNFCYLQPILASPTSFFHSQYTQIGYL